MCIGVCDMFVKSLMLDDFVGLMIGVMGVVCVVGEEVKIVS